MVKIFVATINKIEALDKRMSFSMIVPPDVTTGAYFPSDESLEKGFIIKPDEDLDNPEIHIFNVWIAYLKSNNLWYDWMDSWTSASIYALYIGKEEVPM